MNNTLLIIDFCNTVIRSYSVHPQLSNGDEPTGGLFGTIHQLVKKITDYKPSHIIVCKDKKPYLRNLQYPQYKNDRPPSNEERRVDIGISFKQVTTLFEEMKIPIWEVAGLEADDLIAKLIIDYHQDFNKILVLSNDDDLNQMLHYKNVALFRKNKEYTYHSFKQDYPKVEPKDWVLITSMSGTHNAVQGLPRVGIKTALKYFDDIDLLETIYAKHTKLLDDNYKLILLPFPDINWNVIETPKLLCPQIHEASLIRFIDRYNIRYTTSMMKAFQLYSKRNPTHVRTYNR